MKKRYHLYQFLIAALVLILDRLSKWWIAHSIPLNSSGVQVIPGFFRITHVENRGAAFGLFAESPSVWKTSVLIVLSLAAIAVIAVLLWKSSYRFNSTVIGLSLILGGATGNFWDRIVRGRVVDFLHFYVGQYTWPDFNVADSAIVVGAIILIAEIMFSRPRPAEE
jgi:signal peptidase II